MIPVLLQLGPIPVHSFGLMVALAFVAATALLARSFARAGIETHHAEPIVVWAGLSGLIGARLWYLLFNTPYFWSDPVGALFSGSGFTFYGGFIIAAVIVPIVMRRRGLQIAKVAQCLGPALTLGYAIGRLGCQLSGDGDYGAPVDSWLGMSFAQGVVPTPPGVLVYPTPLYESVLAFGVLWILIHVERSGSFAGAFQRFGLYLALMAVERFFVEFIRVEPRFAFGLSQAQYVAMIMFAAGLVLLISGRSRRAAV